MLCDGRFVSPKRDNSVHGPKTPTASNGQQEVQMIAWNKNRLPSRKSQFDSQSESWRVKHCKPWQFCTFAAALTPALPLQWDTPTGRSTATTTLWPLRSSPEEPSLLAALRRLNGGISAVVPFLCATDVPSGRCSVTGGMGLDGIYHPWFDVGG